MASFLFPTTRMTLNPNLVLASPHSSRRPSLTSGCPPPYVGGSLYGDFLNPSVRPASLNTSSSHRKRRVVTMVIPFSRGSAWEQPPPDLASYLFKNRIVYLGMPFFPDVIDTIVQELLYLQYENEEKKPIYLYINSTGTSKGGEKLSYDTEAFAIYDTMRYMTSPIFTLCVGNAWGEAALLLAAGAKGHRSALPSSTIMIKQPMARFQGQATDVELMRKEVRDVKDLLVKLYSEHIGKSPEEIAADIERPKYFSPSEAVEYGIIDKVLYNERGAVKIEECVRPTKVTTLMNELIIFPASHVDVCVRVFI